MNWDVFISHAGEDKDAVARPIYAGLTTHGVSVWLDAMELRVGDSLREKIDEGLANSRCGIVVLSGAFFAKDWPTRELNGLFALDRDRGGRLLPVWHGVSRRQVAAYSPILANILATDTSAGLSTVVDDLVQRFIELDLLPVRISSYVAQVISNLTPSTIVLLHCIIQESVVSDDAILPFGRDAERGLELAGSAEALYGRSLFVTFGIGGTFRRGIRVLLDTRLLIGSVSSFGLNSDHSAELRAFMMINAQTIEKMVNLSRSGLKKQFYRDEPIPEVVELAKSLKFTVKPDVSSCK